LVRFASWSKRFELLVGVRVKREFTCRSALPTRKLAVTTSVEKLQKSYIER